LFNQLLRNQKSCHLEFSFLFLFVKRAAAAAAAALMLENENHKFMGWPRMDRGDFAGMVNPGSRQIYLTFPADSTFREEDVSNYFRFVFLSLIAWF